MVRHVDGKELPNQASLPHVTTGVQHAWAMHISDQNEFYMYNKVISNDDCEVLALCLERNVAGKRRCRTNIT